MEGIQTKYGSLKGVTHTEYYKDGSIKECMITEENQLGTPHGILVPQYEQDGVRRKYTKALSFYKNGFLKSISLQEQTSIKTSIGVFPAELITFYESGGIKRFFPLNGKITGYWTEENEYNLAQEFEFNFSCGSFKKKVIGIQFYENGVVKSLTLWPRDSVTLQTPAGEIATRIGVALYPDGRIKSVEPRLPITVCTPIGKITAFDRNAVGIHGETNSLAFDEAGNVERVVTSSDQVIVEGPDGKKVTYEPSFKPSSLQPGKLSIVPLQIRFFDEKVQLNQMDTYDVKGNTFTIEKSTKILSSKCNECSGCDACG